jgi:hypothetical protein
MTKKIRKFYSILTSQAEELSHHVSCLLNGQLDFGKPDNLNLTESKPDDQFFAKIKLPLATLGIIHHISLSENLNARKSSLVFQKNSGDFITNH